MKIWSLVKDDEKYNVNHSEEITCFVLTIDSQHIITGSRDMSLKVWQVVGGKLSQVRSQIGLDHLKIRIFPGLDRTHRFRNLCGSFSFG